MSRWFVVLAAPLLSLPAAAAPCIEVLTLLEPACTQGALELEVSAGGGWMGGTRDPRLGGELEAELGLSDALQVGVEVALDGTELPTATFMWQAFRGARGGGLAFGLGAGVPGDDMEVEATANAWLALGGYGVYASVGGGLDGAFTGLALTAPLGSSGAAMLQARIAYEEDETVGEIAPGLGCRSGDVRLTVAVPVRAAPDGWSLGAVAIMSLEWELGDGDDDVAEVTP